MPVTQKRSIAVELLSSLAALTLAALTLAGCGLGTPGTTVQVPMQATGATLRGTVHGGQQPVVGSAIQLYAVGTSGYGSAATPLIAKTIVTGKGGSFDVTGDYTCPSAQAQTYIVATGGNSGYSNNPNLALMAALGPCGQLDSLPAINISEVTTVGSVYLLSPFMAGLTAIGTSSTNAVGISNAVTDVTVLVNLSSGTAGGSIVIPGATLPIAAINTLADILASCVNSQGGSAADTSTPCGQLFSATTTSTTTPTDTVTAVMNIAQNPTSNVATLYSMAPASAPFQPTLAKQPNDFTLAATFTGAGINRPSALAADAAGSIWITNAGSNTVTKLTHSGTPASGSPYTGAFSTPSALAIAADGGAWVTNQGSNSVSRLSATGAPVSNYSGGGLAQPRSIAFDANGTAWIANPGNASVTTISSNGGTLANYTPAAGTAPIAIAVNPH